MHRAFAGLHKLWDGGVARLPLLGNFSYSAIFLQNFSLTNYYPRWGPGAAFRYDDGRDIRNMKREEYTVMRSN